MKYEYSLTMNDIDELINNLRQTISSEICYSLAKDITDEKKYPKSIDKLELLIDKLAVLKYEMHENKI
ncbi:MAG: hypothetical protein IMY67_12300 [Bacteroidetes bacterium]|nr:hypothetical protein [Bacteroidota bacterium]